MQQAKIVGEALRAAWGWQPQFYGVSTAGDEVLDRPMAAIGGKEVFVRTLQKAVLAGEADLAVHSLKDMSPHATSGLALAAVGFAQPPMDCVVSRDHMPLRALPALARVGTAGPRRIALLKKHYPHLQPVLVRGNIQTRLRRVQDGACEAVLLAEAGLQRMDLTHHISERLPVQAFIPAVGQGLLAVECAAANHRLCEQLAKINDTAAAARAAAERAFAAGIGGDCETPLGAHAQVRADGGIYLHAFYAGEDGGFYETTEQGTDGAAVGTAAVQRVLQQARQEPAN